MSTPSKILILEESAAQKVAGHDRVFSFIENPADCFSSDYLSPVEAAKIYDDVFETLMPFFAKIGKGQGLRYRDVDLLWCFKKGLFECGYFIALRHEAFKRLRREYRDASFSIRRNVPSAPHGIGLWDILEAGVPDRDLRVDLLPEYEPSTDRRPHQPFFSWRALPLPVLGRWNTRARKVCVYSDFKKAASVIRSLGRQAVFFSDASSPRVWMESLKSGFGYYSAGPRRITPAHKDFTRAMIERITERPLFSDVRLGDCHAGKLLDRKFHNTLSSSLPPLLAAIDEMHEFFLKVPSLETALLDEDISPSKNAFCQLANRYGVTTSVECHGALGHASGFLPLTADYLLVWGRAQKDKLIRWSCPPVRIKVTGCSRYGSYQKMDAVSAKRKVAKDFWFDPGQKIVVIAFPPFKLHLRLLGHGEQQVIQDVLEAVECFPDTQFILKVHPGDENLDSYVRRYPESRRRGRVAVVEKYDPLLLARACDFLICNNTTFALDAFAMDKPVISVYDDQYRILEEIREFGVFHTARSKEDIERLIRLLLTAQAGKPGRWKEAREHCLNEKNGSSPSALILGHLLDNIQDNQKEAL